MGGLFGGARIDEVGSIRETAIKQSNKMNETLLNIRSVIHLTTCVLLCNIVILGVLIRKLSFINAYECSL